METQIELTQQRDELREVLMDYVTQFGTRPLHGAECRCWQCRMHDDAFDIIARSAPDAR